MISWRYLSPTRARRAFIRLRSSLSMYPKQTMNRYASELSSCSKVEQNPLLSRKSRVNITLKMGSMKHMIAKIGPPVDRDKFKMSAIWLATVNSLVRKRMISLSEFHASLPFTLCLLPASINKEVNWQFKHRETPASPCEVGRSVRTLARKYVNLKTRVEIDGLSTYHSSIAAQNEPWRELWGCSIYSH